jgi:tetratricopeptide (TPR) repeat protein
VVITRTTTLDHLAMLLYNEGELQEAQAYVERGLAMRQALLGMNHLHTALSFYHAGLIAKAHSDLVAARAYYAQALTIYAARLGDEHEQTLVIREELDSF